MCKYDVNYVSCSKSRQPKLTPSCFTCTLRLSWQQEHDRQLKEAGKLRQPYFFEPYIPARALNDGNLYAVYMRRHMAFKDKVKTDWESRQTALKASLVK